MNNQVRGSLNAIFPLESLSLEPSVPFLPAALLWDWDLPLPLTWAFLPLSRLPFSLHPLLSPSLQRSTSFSSCQTDGARDWFSENILSLLSCMSVSLGFSD